MLDWPDESTRAAISVRGLTRQFGGRTAVDDLSFELGTGEIFGLLGPNGAGKTTTLRLMAGLIRPTAGTIAINGIALNRRTAGAIRSQVGLLTETPGLWERLTVAMNLITYARLFGVSDPATAAERSLRTFGLWERRDDTAAVLSKGMKQRVALARALLHHPRVVLLDEPTAGLDPQTAKAIRDLVADLRDQGCTVVLSTHNLDEVERLADRVGLLQRRLVALDTPNSLRERLFGRRVLITSTGDPARYLRILQESGATDVRLEDGALSIAIDHPDTQVPEIVRTLVHAGADIRRVVEEQRPLEDVYLTLMENSSMSREE